MNYPQEKIKPYSNDGKKSEQVEQMFDNIAPAYDQLNHTLSLGIDRSWRRKAINWLKPFRPQQIMDVATGTGGKKGRSFRKNIFCKGRLYLSLVCRQPFRRYHRRFWYP